MCSAIYDAEIAQRNKMMSNGLQTPSTPLQPRLEAFVGVVIVVGSSARRSRAFYLVRFS